MTEFPPIPPAIQARRCSQSPLSYSQESLWFLQQLDPGSSAYNSNFNLTMAGGVEHNILERSLNDLIRRHESLRTLYPNRGGIPMQEVQPFESISLPLIDLSAENPNEARKALDEFLTKKGKEPFDLINGPLSRFTHLRLSNTEDFLFFSIHHINSDAWSRDVFKRELVEVYNANVAGMPSGLSESQLQYSDYAAWQKEWLTGDTLKAYTDHWRSILAGELPVLDLPIDKPRPLVQTYNGIRYSFALSPVLSNQVKAFSLNHRLTPFHFYMAAYAVLLLRYTGQEDLILGCPFANRPLAELEDMIGLFVNTLPIRINLADNPTVVNLVGKVREIMLDAFTWQAVPFEKIVSELDPARDLARTPIFQAAINMRNIPHRGESPGSGISVEYQLRENAPAPFDISLDFDETPSGMLPSFHFNADLFDKQTIVRMAGHFQNILSGFINQPDKPISEIEMLGSAEKKHILFDFNENKADFPDVCAHKLVSAQAARTPQAIAVRCNDEVLTYQQVEMQSNQLARFLKEQGVQPGDRAALFLPRSVRSVVALLAFSKAGAAYLALDITLPGARIAELLSDSNPAIVITDSSVREKLPAGSNVIQLDMVAEIIAKCSDAPVVSGIDNSAVFYILYTSGSTGKPKGLLNLHRGVVNYLHFMREIYQLGAEDSILQLTSLGFDLSIFEIFGFLSYGATVHMMDDLQMRDPDYINLQIESHHISCISAVPTMLRALSESKAAHPGYEHHPKWIFPAGEALLRSDVELIRKAYSNSTKIVNLYGPSECSICQSTYLVPDNLSTDLQGIPIGRPVNNTNSYILDKYLQPVPLGCRGELFIGGVGVGSGYLNRPELTAEKFLPDSFHPARVMYRTGDIVRQTQDGTIHFIGRKDDQVKIRGYRVELGEIEAIIAGYPGVKDAAVRLWKDGRNSILAAYITVHPDSGLELEKSLHEYLNEHLPFYMLPSVIQIMPTLPYTATGKVDKRALPEPGNDKIENSYLAPRDETEKNLVSIWEKVLDVKKIGIRDNFFELGGHSLLAVRMFSMIQKEFGKSIPLVILFKDATIQALATFLENGMEPGYEGVVPISEKGGGSALFVMPAGLYMEKLAHALGTDNPVYALYPVKNGKQIYRDSIQAVAEIYYRNLVGFKQSGPYNLLGHSADGWFALELARLLRSRGHEVGFLGMIDSYPPGYGLKVPFADRIQPHLDELKKKNLVDKIKYLVRSAERESKRRKRASEDARIIKLHRLEAKAMEGRRLLLRTYNPEPYDGDMILFSVTKRPSRAKHDPMESWSKWIMGKLEMVPLEGDHMSILKQPQVQGLADKINQILDRNEKTKAGK